MEDKVCHYVLDIVINDVSFLQDEVRLQKFFAEILSVTELNVIGYLSQKFTAEGEGVTGLFLLSESHLSYHTYPESHYISIDLYTCESRCLSALREIKSRLDSATDLLVRCIERGSNIAGYKNTGVYIIPEPDSAN
ncbi:S-adenosylmethionine decarboxylase [Erwiniaceae bacterium L1_54_6]|nr:S-adenosylmethionine decarboxylase [Erwiniaceae bacterium L1_54_6]